MKKKKFDIVNVLIGMFLAVWGLTIFYPFYNCILISFMTEAELLKHPFALYVQNWSCAAYKQIFSDSKIFDGYKSSLSIMAVSIPLSMLLSTALAYALSRKKFLGSKLINNMIVFTMYFGGGLIPTYLLVKSLGIMNTYWSVILPTAISTYNMILIKSYFYTIPYSLEESAKIDGANDMIIFARIFLPLAKPILATVALFYTVSKWNEWYNPMLYLKSSQKWPVQLVLRDIISNVSEKVEDGGAMGKVFPTNIKMATIVVTMAPIMLIYPFLQKYFMKGILIGAVKS